MQVYILGVSHISRVSCQEIQDLIQTVRPEVLVLELCKDRLRLLLDQVWPAFHLTLKSHKRMPCHLSRSAWNCRLLLKLQEPGFGTTELV